MAQLHDGPLPAVEGAVGHGHHLGHQGRVARDVFGQFAERSAVGAQPGQQGGHHAGRTGQQGGVGGRIGHARGQALQHPLLLLSHGGRGVEIALRHPGQEGAIQHPAPVVQGRG